MSQGIPHSFPASRPVSASGGATAATIYFYYTGTTNLAPIYSDLQLTVPMTNPQTVSAGGIYPHVFLDPSVTYRRRVVFDDGSFDDNDPIPFGSLSTGTTTPSSVDQLMTTSDVPEQSKGWTLEWVSDSVVKLKLLGSDGVVRSTTFNLTGPNSSFFRRPIFQWNGNAGLSGARWPSFCPITDTTGLITYSTRHSSATDGEIGYRLEVVPYTLNTTSKTVTLGTSVVVSTPSSWTSGTGAVWADQLLRLPSGRILLFATELNSPDGTYTNAASRYDTVMFYSDNGGTTWSSKQVLQAGSTAYTDFGLAAYPNPASGLNIPNQVAIRTTAGRIILTGFLTDSPNNYLASLYTDDASGVTGWSRGVPLQYPSSGYNEPTTVICPDGTVRAFVRNESLSCRGIFALNTSTMTWTFERTATDVPIRNVANSGNAIGSSIILGGATDPSDNRLGYKFFVSTDNANSFGAGVSRLFNQKQRIGYAFLMRLNSDYWGLVYDVTSSQVTVSFNQKPGIGMLVFNDSCLTQDVTPPAADSTLYDAATEYATYSAWVTGDGGTIGNSTKCQAAITAAIAGNYYSQIGFAVSVEFGSKIAGAGTDKLYSLGPVQKTSTSSGQTTSLAVDTTTVSTRKLLKFPDSGAFAKFTSQVLRSGSRCAFVMLDKASDTSSNNGFGVSWTDTNAHYVFAGATFNVNGTAIIQGSPQYGTTSADTSHFYLDFDALEANHGKNGVDFQSVTGWPKYSNAGATFDLKVTDIGGANRLMAECWHLNGPNVTDVMAAKCGADVHSRW